MASNIQSEINKKNKLNVDKVLDWITGYFDDKSVSSRGRRYSSAAQKRRMVNKAKKIAKEPLKSDTVVTQTSLKNEIKKELDPEFFAKPSANRMEKNVDKKAASKPKPKQAAPAPKPKDKPVRGPKNIKSRLKTVSDKRKAEEVSARKKASKEQPIGPSDAPKESKKKEGKSVKESLKDMLLKQDKRTIDTPVGKLTVDSTDEGMSKFLGAKEDIERQEMEE